MLLRGVAQDMCYSQSRDRIVSMVMRRVTWVVCAGVLTRLLLTIFTRKMIVDPMGALRSE